MQRSRLLSGIASGLLLLLAVPGCGDSHLEEFKKPAWIPKTATWPEFQALYERKEDFKKPSFEKVRRSQGQGAKLLTDDPEFKANLKKFEETPIPAEFDTPERQAAKKDIVAEFNRLGELAKKKDAKGVLESIQKLVALQDKVMKIPGQEAPPPGQEKNYAPRTSPNPEVQSKKAPVVPKEPRRRM